MINYSIHNFLDPKNNLIAEYTRKRAACFADLFDNSIYYPDNIKYFDDKIEPKERISKLREKLYKCFVPFDLKNPGGAGHINYNCQIHLNSRKVLKGPNLSLKDIIIWYSEVLNSFGLTHNIEVISKDYKKVTFKVFYYQSIMKLMVTLAALRYLQENHFPKMIEWFYLNKDWAAAGDKNPNKEKLFILFLFYSGGRRSN